MDTLFFQDGLNKAIESSKSLNNLFVVLIVNENDTSNKILQIFKNETLIQYINDSKKFITIQVNKESEDFNNFIQFCPCTDFPSLYFFSNTGQIIAKHLEFKEEELNHEFIESLYKTSLNTFTQLALLSILMLQSQQKQQQQQQQQQQSTTTVNPSKPQPPQPPQPKTTSTSSEAKNTNSNNNNNNNSVPKKSNTTISTNAIKPKTDIKPTTPTTTTTTTTTSTSLNSTTPSVVTSTYIPPPISNIIVKLTNGDTLRNQFLNEDKLKVVKEFIDKNRTDTGSTYTLMTIHPRRVFTEKDLNLSLLDLQLVPSATLVLTSYSSNGNSPAGSLSPTFSSSNSESNYSSYLTGYYESFKSSLSNILFGGGIKTEYQVNRDEQSNVSPPQSTNVSRYQTSNIHSLSSGSSSNSNNSGNNNNQQGKSNIKKRNIHQIHDSSNNKDEEEEDKDKNNYYNGNSTQYK